MTSIDTTLTFQSKPYLGDASFILTSFQLILITYFSLPFSDPPKIADSLYETDLTVVERRPVQLDCNVSGNPEPQLSWLKDGVVINSTSQVRILRGGRVIQVPASSVDDDGRYTCTASNAAGQAEKVYRLQVLGKNLR